MLICIFNVERKHPMIDKFSGGKPAQIAPICANGTLLLHTAPEGPFLPNLRHCCATTWFLNRNYVSRTARPLSGKKYVMAAILYFALRYLLMAAL